MEGLDEALSANSVRGGAMGVLCPRLKSEVVAERKGRMPREKYNLGIRVGSKGANQETGGRRRTCALNGRCCVGRRASRGLVSKMRPLAWRQTSTAVCRRRQACKLASLHAGSDVIGLGMPQTKGQAWATPPTSNSCVLPPRRQDERTTKHFAIPPAVRPPFRY